MLQDVDPEKWRSPAGSPNEAGGFSAAAEGADDKRGVRETNDGGFNQSTRAMEEHPPRSSLSNENLQVYIGAHDYLVMASVTARSQPKDLNVDGTASALVEEASSFPSIPRGRISSSNSADFIYGRVEVRAKLASGGSSGFWLVPSDAPVFGRTPCARISIAEVSRAG